MPATLACRSINSFLEGLNNTPVPKRIGVARVRDPWNTEVIRYGMVK